MTDRERLTKHWGNNCVATKLNYDFLLTLPNIEVKNFNAIIQKLANYEDLEEQGKIIVPPCKVGAELYCVYSPPRPANPADKGKWYMGEFEVARFHYGVKGLSIEMYGYGTVSVNEIGKTVFLSREEAEQALKERKNNG